MVRKDIRLNGAGLMAILVACWSCTTPTELGESGNAAADTGQALGDIANANTPEIASISTDADQLTDGIATAEIGPDIAPTSIDVATVDARALVCTKVSNCDDGNLCTTDTCDAASGCQHSTACNDGDACTTNDKCEGNKCLGSPKVCLDQGPCTDEACSGGLCVVLPNGVTCTDGNACTADDTCTGGTCWAGVSVACDDLNPCTDDACDPAKGCIHLTNVAACTDDDACTDGDSCANGKCAPGPSPLFDNKTAGSPKTDIGYGLAMLGGGIIALSGRGDSNDIDGSTTFWGAEGKGAAATVPWSAAGANHLTRGLVALADGSLVASGWQFVGGAKGSQAVLVRTKSGAAASEPAMPANGPGQNEVFNDVTVLAGAGFMAVGSSDPAGNPLEGDGLLAWYTADMVPNAAKPPN